ncbi:cation efflux family protein [Wolffia australiana]
MNGEGISQRLYGDYGFGNDDRRLAFSRQDSFRSAESLTPTHSGSYDYGSPLLVRNSSSISIPPGMFPGVEIDRSTCVVSVIRAIMSGNRLMKRLSLMIFLNVAYSATELVIGLLTGRVGLVSDAFHLTFGCGLLSFSLVAMAMSSKKSDTSYTYGYKRLDALAAFTNALFLVFLAFSLSVEALHVFTHYESEHKHYLVVSAVTNLLVNLLGVWFFRGYARIHLTYRNAEDMNHHSVFLHVLADSIRSAGLLLASWFLTLGVENAEVLCLGLVSIAIFMVAIPLFRSTGSTLLQAAPTKVPSSAFNKCWRQISALEDVLEVSRARFWELVPGHVVGSLSILLKEGAEELPVLRYAQSLYAELGIQDLTIEALR